MLSYKQKLDLLHVERQILSPK